MSGYQPLSVRRGLRAASELREGVPDHLSALLSHWLRQQLGGFSTGDRGVSVMLTVAAATRMVIPHNLRDSIDMREFIITTCTHSEDRFLDVLDATLHTVRSDEAASSLKQHLYSGGSTWTVAPDGCSLQRRVDGTATANFEAASSPADEASAELHEAWASIYGRNPNPSDAWDHAIKAIEAVLIPIVVPNKQKATLGDVLGQLKGSPGTYDFPLQTTHQLGGVPTLEAMLRLMWPNPDRHGGSNGRAPRPDEAEAVVQLAVTVVQWTRAGMITKK